MKHVTTLYQVPRAKYYVLATDTFLGARVIICCPNSIIAMRRAVAARELANLTRIHVTTKRPRLRLQKRYFLFDQNDVDELDGKNA